MMFSLEYTSALSSSLSFCIFLQVSVLYIMVYGVVDHIQEEAEMV